MQQLSRSSAWPVYGRDALRLVEAQIQQGSATPLMQKAGLAAAQLALALAPHAERIWVAAGPGNNGGDGLEAALHLHQWGKAVTVTLWADPHRLPADAHAAWLRAQAAGVEITPELPEAWLNGMSPLDLCIDALLGIGAERPLSAALQTAVQALNRSPALTLSLDAPTGLNPESGQALSPDSAHRVCADHTLTFIAAKPGLFMGQGRDACGVIWLEDLGFDEQAQDPRPHAQALLNPCAPHRVNRHASHKGLQGDVAVIGGESIGSEGFGMRGAALLAASAAVHAGAGRVILSLLSGQALESAPFDMMQRDWRQLELRQLSVVCGCGGGQSVRAALPEVLQQSAQLVLDADALNALAQDAMLQDLLKQRGAHQPTVITPHPLEAARLLQTHTAEVQQDRLLAAQRLARLFNCTAVLKGSGSVIAAPGQTPRINTSGNGRLAIGGTGDVLAGLIGARLAQGASAFDAALSAVAQHGQLANDWPAHQPLTASQLARKLN